MIGLGYRAPATTSSSVGVFDPTGAKSGGVRGFGDLQSIYYTTDLGGVSGTISSWTPRNADGATLTTTSTFKPTLDTTTTLDGYPALNFSNAAQSALGSPAMADNPGNQPWAMFCYVKLAATQATANFLNIMSIGRYDFGGTGSGSTGGLLQIMNNHDAGAAPFIQGWLNGGYDGRTQAGLSANGDGKGGVRDRKEPVVSSGQIGTIPFLNLPLLLLLTWDPQNGLRMYRNGALVASMSITELALFSAANSKCNFSNAVYGFGATAKAVAGGDPNVTNCPDFALFAGGFWIGPACDTSPARVDAFHAWAASQFPSLVRAPSFIVQGSSLEKASVSGGLYTTSWIEGAFAAATGLGDKRILAYAGGSMVNERGTASGNYSGLYGVSDGTNFLGTQASPEYNTAFDHAYRDAGLKWLTTGQMPVLIAFGGLCTHDLDAPTPKTAIQCKAFLQAEIARAGARGLRVALFTVMGRGDRTQAPTNPNGSPAWTNAAETESIALRADILANWNAPLGAGGVGGYGGGSIVCDVWDLWGWLNSRGAPQDSVSVRNDAVGSGTFINPDGVHQKQAAHNILIPLVTARLNLLKTQRFMTTLAT